MVPTLAESWFTQALIVGLEPGYCTAGLMKAVFYPFMDCSFHSLTSL